MSKIIETLQDWDLAQQLLPIWTDWGVPDIGVSIHSLGISFLTHTGQQLDYMSISEFPVPRQGRYSRAGEDIRCDSTWFDRQTRSPILIAEFERYSGVSDQLKLENKVKNLLLAHHRWGGTAQWLVLAYWTQGLTYLPDHSRFEQIVQEGFETSERQKVSGKVGGDLVCLQFLHQETTSQSLQLIKILRRGTP